MDWNIVMATAMLAMLPPTLVVILMQKWFVKGLVDTGPTPTVLHIGAYRFFSITNQKNITAMQLK